MASSIEHVRHSFAHLLAAAVERVFPGALNTIGPAVDNGFYYDFDFGPTKVSDADLAKLEGAMRSLLPTWKGFEGSVVSKEDALARFAGNPYKIELINDIAAKGEEITLYTSGEFVDLCRGGHAEIADMAPDAFKLSRIAGAYWRGDEKNKMLTRIYGLAFATKAELDEYEARAEEAKRRDHRVLGDKMDLFMISEEVGKGLPLWLPDGAFIRRKLEDFMYEKELERGYKYVNTPVLTHKRLYEQSGHLAHYHEDMYSPIEIEGEEYYLRPMNCPHHHQIFNHRPLSYRNLPLRISEFGLVHRFERSGVLTGLIRARCFTQNDAHIYCAKSDLKSEVIAVLGLFREVYDDVFGITDYWFRLSLPDFSNKEKYGDIDDRAMWDEASDATRQALEEFGAKYVEGGGEAAFYGPKIDVQTRNVAGKEDTIATIQVDFYSAKRFGMEFTNSEGRKESPVVIHRAIMGSFDRFFAFLVERYAGAFPVWLSPVQARVLPINDKCAEYAAEAARVLREAGVRVEVDSSDDSLGKRIHAAKASKVPYFVVIGEKEMAAGTLSVEGRDGSKTAMSAAELAERISGEAKARTNSVA
jgi:threonyl-tRNA synthetase